MLRRDFLKSAATIGAVASVLPQTLPAEEKLPASESKLSSPKPQLQFTDNGTFKIVQITDTHYRTDKDFSKESIKLIAETIEAEKPQLVIYTGDIVVSVNIYKGWDDILSPCIESKTAWAVVLGNHDDEAKITRKQIINHIKNKPFSVTEMGPDDIGGCGNYVLEIFDKSQRKFLIYCMDSNAYSTIKNVQRYGWFKPSQIAWYKSRSSEYTKNNGNKPLPSLAFFHIPLNEFAEMVHFKNKIIGDRGEAECCGAINSGMFLSMVESGGVLGVFVGHDHVNDYVGLRHGVALGYGRFSGTKTTYVKEPHGARVIELNNTDPNSFKTHIRLRTGESIHQTQIPADFQKKKTS
ncbi:MAG: metallophosphoesterase family protein [Planctomycetaceae bacterium]|jgi:3',5'-cyclic AMP phosphodiesterase CpdA|nr:metallophosphoesterase family protein [Planctomycetaceae bacterium]